MSVITQQPDGTWRRLPSLTACALITGHKLTRGAYFKGWGYMRFWEPGLSERPGRGRADVAQSKGHGDDEDQLFRGRVTDSVMLSVS